MIEIETATPGQVAIIKADLDRIIAKASKLAELEIFRVPSNPLLHFNSAVSAVEDFSLLIEDGEGLELDQWREYADAMLVAAAMAVAALVHARNENSHLLEAEL